MPFVLLILLIIGLGPGLPSISGADGGDVSFVGEFQAGEPISITADPEGNVYAAQDDGTIHVYAPGGGLKGVLQCTDAKGRKLLEDISGLHFASDKLYVADSGRNMVFVFTKDCSLVDSFGRRGVEAKEFKGISAVFVSSGVIYTADAGNDRLQVFGPNGVFIGIRGEAADYEDVRNLIRPRDVAIDDNGVYYAIDGDRNWVQAVRGSGEHILNYTGMEAPVALAIGTDGLYVADARAHKIRKYKFSGIEAFSFGHEGKEGRGAFLEISDIAVDASGRIYVSDKDKGTIQVFEESGSAQEKSQAATSPPTYALWREDLPVRSRKLFWDGKRLYSIRAKDKVIDVIEEGRVARTIAIPKVNPVALAADPKGFLWVVDAEEDRLVKVDAQGGIVLSVGSRGKKEGYFREPADIVINKDGLVFVSEKGNGRVQMLNTDGMFLGVVAKEAPEFFKSPSAMAIGSDGRVYVLDEARENVTVLSINGKPAGGFGGPGIDNASFTRPTDIEVGGDEVFVLDSGNYRVQVFNTGGGFLRVFGAEGRGKGDFDRAASLAVSKSALLGTRVYVAEEKAERVQAIDIVYTPVSPSFMTARSGMRRIDLSWDTSPETYVQSYRIYRSEHPYAGFTPLATVLTPGYEDSGVTPGVKYYYRASAISANGTESNLSQAVRSAAQKAKTAAPSGLSAASRPDSVVLAWKPEADPNVKSYRVYRKTDEEFLQIAETSDASHTDAGLDPDTRYEYRLSSVSIDGEESGQTGVLRVLTLPDTAVPIEIDVARLDNIFSNTYKLYESDGIGEVRITNNLRDDLASVKVSFTIRDFMDFPVETELKDLASKETRTLPLKAVFNNRILSVTEDTPVQAEVKAVYYKNEEPREYVKTYTIKLYEKHHLLWDRREKIATFVTPKDEAVMAFTRQIASQYSRPHEQDPLVYASALFNAFGTIGMTYMQDPTNPYQVASETADLIDYVQYPQETLKRKSGDCDDLVGLYASALESLGIPTKLLVYPGHILLMFSSGIEPGTFGAETEAMFVEHDGTLWVPVEVTLVGQPFLKAWSAGVENHRQWADDGLETIDLKEAWKTYKPASLAAEPWRAETVDRTVLEVKFSEDFLTLQKLRIRGKTEQYLARLAGAPDDSDAANQLGIIYADFGLHDDAIRTFAQALALAPGDAAIQNNTGNLHYIAGRYAEALVSYQVAAGLDPKDPHIFVNLARCYLKLARKAEANKAFRKAYSIDKEVFRIYQDLSLQLM